MESYLDKFACIAVVSYPASAITITHEGTVIFEDGFEAGTIDTPPGPAITGTWTFQNGGNGGHIDVSQAGDNHAGLTGPAAFEGSQYFQYHSIVADDVRAHAVFDGGVIPDSGILRAEFMMYMPATGGQQANTIFKAVNQGVTFGIAAGLRTEGNLTDMDYWDGVQWTDLFDGGGTRVTNPLDTWNKWIVELDLDTDEATYTVDGVTAGPLAGSPNHDPIQFAFESNRVAGTTPSYYVDKTGLVVPPRPDKTWRVNASGDWNVGSNWTGGIPDNDHEIAIFGEVITTPKTVFTDNHLIVQSIQFLNSNTYAVAGTGSVTLAKGTTPGVDRSQITVFTGNHEFQAPVNLNNETDVTVASGSTLSFFNALDLRGNTLNKVGPGEVAIRSDLIASGGTVNILGGIVSGNGTVSGSVSNEGGTISPGNNSSVGGQVPEPGAVMLLVLGGMLISWCRAAIQRKTR